MNQIFEAFGDAIDLHVLDERIGEQDLTAARFILKGTTKNETPIHLLSAGKADLHVEAETDPIRAGSEQDLGLRETSPYEIFPLIHWKDPVHLALQLVACEVNLALQ